MGIINKLNTKVKLTANIQNNLNQIPNSRKTVRVFDFLLGTCDSVSKLLCVVLFEGWTFEITDDALGTGIANDSGSANISSSSRSALSLNSSLGCFLWK